MSLPSLRLVLLAVLILAALGVPSAGEPARQVYLSMTGSGAQSGADCANAHDLPWFNSAEAWGKSRGKIGPGVTVHFCGVISERIVVRESGAAGQPIILRWEPGARVSLPQCGSRSLFGGGCVAIRHLNYIVLDGGADGVVEATEAGSGLRFSGGDFAPGVNAIDCDNCEIRNLTVRNIYRHTDYADSSTGGPCISLSGQNVSAHDNTVQQCGRGILIQAVGSSANIAVQRNKISAANWCIGVTASGPFASLSRVQVLNNECSDVANWDDAANANHRDGIHLFNANGARLSDVFIYNNYFHGRFGKNVTAQIFLDTPADSVSPRGTNIAVFNNVLAIDPEESYPMLRGGGAGVRIINNTFLGNTNGRGLLVYLRKADHVIFANNLMQYGNTSVWLEDVNIEAGGLGGNVWYHVGNNPWKIDAKYFHSLAAWQEAAGANFPGSGKDATSTTDDPELDAQAHPRAGSVALQIGRNFSNAGIPALTRDMDGAPRPKKGRWCAGARNAATRTLAKGTRKP